MRAQLINTAKYNLAFALGGGLLYLALRSLTWDALLAALQRVHFGWLVLSLFFMFAAHGLRGLRWQQLLQAAGQQTTGWHSFLAVMVGYMVNYAVPRLGEVSRCTILQRSDKVALPAALGTVVSERLIDMLVFALLLLSAFVIEADALTRLLAGADLRTRLPHIEWLLACVVVALLGLGLLWRWRLQLLRIGVVQDIWGFVQQLLRTMLSIRQLQHPLRFTFYTMGIWLGYWLAAYFGLLAMGTTTSYTPYFAFLTLAITTIAMVLPTPGGIGAYQFAVNQVFWLYAMPELEGQVFGVLSQGTQALANIVAGIIGYIILMSVSGKQPAISHPIKR